VFRSPAAGTNSLPAWAADGGNELLTCGFPPADVVAAYVEANAGSLVGQDNAGFVLFFNRQLRYWHLADAGIVPADYDTEAEGHWGREHWRYWVDYVTRARSTSGSISTRTSPAASPAATSASPVASRRATAPRR
jgi:hypothetical protein